jgi:hypothetical protein
MSLPPDLEEKRNQEAKEAETFSFDEKALAEEIKQGDMVTMVIRGHLHLEHVLIQTLLDAFVVPDAVQLRRINFPAKVDLCIALGLIPEFWRDAVLKMNEMRNRVAHRLKFEFAESEKVELVKMVPKFLREILLDDAKVAPNELEKLAWWRIFYIATLWLDIARQKAKVARIDEKYGALYLRRTLERAKGRPIIASH